MLKENLTHEKIFEAAFPAFEYHNVAQYYACDRIGRNGKFVARKAATPIENLAMSCYT